MAYPIGVIIVSLLITHYLMSTEHDVLTFIVMLCPLLMFQFITKIPPPPPPPPSSLSPTLVAREGATTDDAGAVTIAMFYEMKAEVNVTKKKNMLLEGQVKRLERDVAKLEKENSDMRKNRRAERYEHSTANSTVLPTCQ